MVVTDKALEERIDRTRPIGSGTSRDVYSVRDSSDLVIKEMKHPFPMANMIEWLVWDALVRMAEDFVDTTRNPDLQNLFARCFEISQSGSLLLMERLTPLSEDDPFDRTRFPYWLNDIKPRAFGKDTSFGKNGEGQIKVMDYAEVNFYDILNPLNRYYF